MADSGSTVKQALITLRKMQAEIDALKSIHDEPIAIIGMGCRFPGGGDSPSTFYASLLAGTDAVTEVPADRFRINPENVAHLKPSQRRALRFGAFLGDVRGFDREFFGITPREASKLDPQQRLLLEVAWEAIEDAGIPADRLMGTRTGIFLGISTNDYSELCADLPPPARDAYVVTGNGHCFPPGRLAYALGLQGPALAVDTACSSSLVAIHLACGALRSGDCTLGLVGGVNLMLSPWTSIAISQTDALSPDGRCKAFDAAANGFVRGEGCGVVVLKRLGDAQRDGDPIWAIIRGSAVNQDGRSTGLTAPNVRAQEAMLRQALDNAKVAAADIDYVECHGTGTSLGDPIEFEALNEVLGKGRSSGARCVLGAVKTNLGHLEAAAGVAGLIKAVLALRHGTIPKNLHFKALNPRLSIAGTPFVLPTENLPWESQGKRRRAGVSSFGMSGTNAHIVLEEAPPSVERPAAAARTAGLFLLSARTEPALGAQALRLAEHLALYPELAPGDVAYSLATTRSAMEQRLGLCAGSADELQALLRAAAEGKNPPGVLRGQASVRGKLAFLFTGQGAQTPGMGRSLHRTFPSFAEAFDRCLELFAALKPSLLSVMWAEPGSQEAALLDQTGYTQPALFVFEYALYTLWRSLGVEPDLLCGHSIGEIVAACVAGIFSLEDAAQLVLARARLMQELPAGGAMAAIAAPEAEVLRALVPHAQSVSLGAINAPSQVVISGEEKPVLEIAAAFSARGVRTSRLNVSHAFHSPCMDPMLPAFEKVARTLRYSRPTIPLCSNLSGKLAGDEIVTPDYWVRHVREAVRFGDGVLSLRESFADRFLELGPRPLLLGSLPATLKSSDLLLLASVRKDQEEAASFLKAAGALWAAGGRLDFAALFAKEARRISLPTYPWQRQPCWIEKGAPEGQRAKEQTDAELHEKSVADWFYRTTWQRAAAPPARPPLAMSRWLVLAEKETADALAAALRNRGCSSVFVVEPESSAPIAAAMSGAADWDGVVYLPEKQDLARTATGKEVGEKTHLLLSSLLCLLRAAVQWTRPPKIWVVTQGACSVGDEATASPIHAALWGLGQVIALERPEAFGGLIDLELGRQTEQLEPLAEALLSSEGEDQLALRGGERYLARLVRKRIETAERLTLRKDASYLVTGGLGGIGLAVARFFAERGAKHLWLTGRRGLASPGAAEAVDALRAQGVRVEVAAVDAADAEGMAALIASISPPLQGVIHAAGISIPCPVVDIDPHKLAQVLRPKVEGGFILEQLLKEQPLDFFVHFSSLAGVWGAASAGAYAAANAFLDGLARACPRQGRTTLSIGWGVWADGGMSEAAAKEHLQELGVLPMPTAAALLALERALEQARGSDGTAVLAVTRMDWERFAPIYGLRGKRRFLEALSFSDRPKKPAAASERFRARPAPPAKKEISQLVRSIVAAVFGFADESLVDTRRGFAEQGLDSLMAVQIQGRLQDELGLALSSTVAFDHPSVERLSEYVFSQLGRREAGAERQKGTAPAGTTKLAAQHTAAETDHIRVVGYIRVSTDMQVMEGVSLDAQSEKIKAYCKLHDVELIGICKDEGLSANSLERPGLKSALAMLERGKANTLLVVKLDRLTRSLLDLDMLIRGYFAKERFHLLSVSESLDTRSAMGRFVLYILGLIAQWERDAIGERTREAMAHLKQQGVQLGAAPYGYRYSSERDGDGRKRLVEVPEQLEVIVRILEMFDAGTSARQIAERLGAEGVAAPNGEKWYGTAVRRILERNERPSGRRCTGKRTPRVWDRERATELALACRKEGMSLRAIAKQLHAAGLAPPRGGHWHAAGVKLLLGPHSAVNAVDERTRAQQLRAEGRTLREIGRLLLAEGYRPPRAAQWHTQALSAMLTSAS